MSEEIAGSADIAPTISTHLVILGAGVLALDLDKPAPELCAPEPGEAPRRGSEVIPLIVKHDPQKN